MPETYTYPLDGGNNVELEAEDLNRIQQNFNLYVKNNPYIAREELYSYLRGLFVPYIIA
jgi:Ca2+-binding EF-hand superfamily protein